MVILAALLLVVLDFLAPHNARAGTKPGIVIQLCTDDPAEVHVRFFQAMNNQLTFCRVLEESDCSTSSSLPDNEHLVIGRFVTGSNAEVSLSLELADSDVKRSREIPWLGSEQLPLQRTLQEKRVASLAILIDNLVLEFHRLNFEQAPSVQVEKETQPPHEEPSPEPDEPPAPDKSTKLSHWIGIFSGFDYLTPAMIAPLVGLGYDLHIERFAVAVQLSYEFDSSYELDGREFETSAVQAKLGAKYLFLSRSAGFLGAGLDFIWRYNRFRRNDLENTGVKSWSSFGVGALAHGRLKLAGPFGIFLKPGIELYPFARELKIKDGPMERALLFAVSVTAGFDLYF